MEGVNGIQSFIFGFLLVAFVLMGWSYRTNDDDQYHTVNRSAERTRIIFSLFTVVGASEFVIFTTLAFVFGWKSIWFFAGTTLGFFFLAAISDRIRFQHKERDLHSIPDLAARQGYRWTAMLLTFLSVIFTLSLVVLQIMIGGAVIAEIAGLEYNLSAGIICVAVALYLIFGGYNALLNTDLVQGTMMMVLTGLMLGYLWTSAPEAAASTWMFYAPEGVNLDVLVFALGGFFAIAGGPEVWQRVLTVKSDAKARESLVLGGLAMLIWGTVLVLGTLLIRSLMPEVNPDNAFLEFLPTLPPSLLGAMMVLLLAAIVSTADTELFASSVIAHKEIIRKHDNMPLQKKQTLLLILAFSAVAYCAAIFLQNLLTLYLAIIYLSFITGSTGIAIVLNRGTKLTHFLAVLVSTVLLFGLYLSGKLVGIHPLLILLPCLLPWLVAAPKTAD